jgi:hypothetical protein
MLLQITAFLSLLPFFLDFLRQDLAMQPSLASNSGFSCLYLWNAEITGMCQHVWPGFHSFYG